MEATDIDFLEKLEEECTPGPWRACGCGECGLVWSEAADKVVANVHKQYTTEERGTFIDLKGFWEAANEIAPSNFAADAKMVAQVRNKFRPMLDYIRKLEKKVKDYERDRNEKAVGTSAGSS